MDRPEFQWIAEYRGGDTQALGRLVEHTRRPLFGYIIKMMERSQDAEEIFQEVWFRAIRKLDTYEPRYFLAWLIRIAHNLVIDRGRKHGPVASLQDCNDEGIPLEDQIGSLDDVPDRSVAERELGVRIVAAASRLPEEQREVFMLRTEAGMPFKEIARIQGVSINTALARMQYALTKLREELREDLEAWREAR